MPDWVATMNGAKAPGPASPGMGTGNIPFAPGVMSGDLGQHTNPQQLARESHGVMNARPQQGPPPPGPQGQPPAPGGGPQGPAAGMGGTPNINPEVYLRMLDIYMGALMKMTESGQSLVRGIY